VTGSATTLGIKDKTKAAALAAERNNGKSGKQADMDDASLLKHYEGMYDDSAGGDDQGQTQAAVAFEVKAEQFDHDHEDEEEADEPTPPAESTPVDALVSGGLAGTSTKMISVNGVSKPLDEITEEDQEEMTPDEYQVSENCDAR
jgi:transcription initiation factor TFIIE subunit alpha